MEAPYLGSRSTILDDVFGHVNRLPTSSLVSLRFALEAILIQGKFSTDTLQSPFGNRLVAELKRNPGAAFAALPTKLHEVMLELFERKRNYRVISFHPPTPPRLNVVETEAEKDFCPVTHLSVPDFIAACPRLSLQDVDLYFSDETRRSWLNAEDLVMITKNGPADTIDIIIRHAAFWESQWAMTLFLFAREGAQSALVKIVRSDMGINQLTPRDILLILSQGTKGIVSTLLTNPKVLALISTIVVSIFAVCDAEVVTELLEDPGFRKTITKGLIRRIVTTAREENIIALKKYPELLEKLPPDIIANLSAIAPRCNLQHFIGVREIRDAITGYNFAVIQKSGTQENNDLLMLYWDVSHSYAERTEMAEKEKDKFESTARDYLEDIAEFYLQNFELFSLCLFTALDTFKRLLSEKDFRDRLLSFSAMRVTLSIMPENHARAFLDIPELRIAISPYAIAYILCYGKSETAGLLLTYPEILDAVKILYTNSYIHPLRTESLCILDVFRIAPIKTVAAILEIPTLKELIDSSLLAEVVIFGPSERSRIFLNDYDVRSKLKPEHFSDILMLAPPGVWANLLSYLDVCEKVRDWKARIHEEIVVVQVEPQPPVPAPTLRRSPRKRLKTE